MPRTKEERYSQIEENSNKEELLSSITDVEFILADNGNTYNVKMDVIAKHFIEKMFADGTLHRTLTLGSGLKFTDDGKIAVDYGELDKRYIRRSNLSMDMAYTAITGNINTHRPLPVLDDLFVEELITTNGRVVSTGRITTFYNLHVMLNKKFKVFPSNEFIGNKESLKNHYIYATQHWNIDPNVADIRLLVSPERLNETANQMCLAYIDANGTIHSAHFTRLGKYRINKLPRGSSFPSSRGPASDVATSYWLTEQY